MQLDVVLFSVLALWCQGLSKNVRKMLKAVVNFNPSSLSLPPSLSLSLSLSQCVFTAVRRQMIMVNQESVSWILVNLGRK